MMVDILLNNEQDENPYYRYGKEMIDRARKLAMDSDDISIEDSIRLLEKYGSEKDKPAIKYLKSMLPEEKTEQQ